MFTLLENVTYPWPVKWQQPSQDKPGELETVEITVTYHRLSVTDHQALMTETVESGLKDPDFAQRVVAGFAGVLVAGGAPLPFSDENLRRLMNVPNAGPAIVRGYYESRHPAAEKNS